MAEVENPVKVDVPALTGTCQSDDSEDVWKQLYTKVFSSIPTRDGSWKENYVRTEKLFRQFADKFTEEKVKVIRNMSVTKPRPMVSSRPFRITFGLSPPRLSRSGKHGQIYGIPNIDIFGEVICLDMTRNLLATVIV